MRVQTDEFLVRNQLDPVVLKKVRDSAAELQDLPALRKGLSIMNRLQECPVCITAFF